MKKRKTLLVLFVVLTFQISCTKTKDKNSKFIYNGNPLVQHLFTADPSARVFRNRLYVYTSHDENDATESEHFIMFDWRVFSANNLEDWTDHGAIFSLDDISWSARQAWAPDCVERNGNYYFYFPVEQTQIGVAAGDTSTGPFKDALGKPLIDRADNKAAVGREPIDPAILIDDDGQTYMYLGCRDARVVKLKENMTELAGEIQPVVIHGNEGDAEHNGDYYAETPWVFKRNGMYYFIYYNGWRDQSTIVYAMGTNPIGPFEFVGEGMSPVGAGTGHAAIVEFKGKWYIFYHNNVLSDKGKRRSVGFDEITFTPDGKINRLVNKALATEKNM